MNDGNNIPTIQIWDVFKNTYNKVFIKINVLKRYGFYFIYFGGGVSLHITLYFTRVPDTCGCGFFSFFKVITFYVFIEANHWYIIFLAKVSKIITLKQICSFTGKFVSLIQSCHKASVPSIQKLHNLRYEAQYL